MGTTIKENNIPTVLVLIAHFFNIAAQNMDSKTKRVLNNILPLALSGYVTLTSVLISLCFSFFIIIPTSQSCCRDLNGPVHGRESHA